MEASNATSNDDIVINHFCRQIFHALGYPDKHTAIVRRKWRVAATASWYLRQFYLKSSLLDHDPRIIMLCAIFLAGKIEDHFVNMEDLFRIYKRVPESYILDSEILLLEGLDFNLKVFHPQNCMHTIIADMKRLAQSSLSTSWSEQDVLNWKQKISALTSSWLSKTEEYLILVQTSSLITKLDPLCIAIIVLQITAPEGLEEELGFQSYLENKFSIEYLQASIYPHLSVVKETILSEGDGVQTAAAAEQLQVCIKELRHRKRWIKT